MSSVEQLIEVLKSAKFLEIYNRLDEKQREKNWEMPRPAPWLANQGLIDERKYGQFLNTPAAIPNGWDTTDHTWNAIIGIMLVNSSNSLPHKLELGPHEGKEDIEKYNRVFQLIRMCKFYKNAKPSNKNKEGVTNRLDELKENMSAVVPDFMRPASERSGVSDQPPGPLPPRQFQVHINYSRSTMNNQRINKPTPFTLRADPRVYDGPGVRDYVKRDLDLPMKGLTVDTFSLMFYYCLGRSSGSM